MPISRIHGNLAREQLNVIKNKVKDNQILGTCCYIHSANDDTHTHLIHNMYTYGCTMYIDAEIMKWFSE